MAKRAPDLVDKYAGKRLRMRRLMVGMTQTELGDALKVSYQQVQNYEKGVNRISGSRLQQMANVLGVPVTFFLEGSPGQRQRVNSASSQDFIQEFLATSYGLALVRTFTRLSSAKLRRRIVNLVEAIADE